MGSVGVGPAVAIATKKREGGTIVDAGSSSPLVRPRDLEQLVFGELLQDINETLLRMNVLLV